MKKFLLLISFIMASSTGFAAPDEKYIYDPKNLEEKIVTQIKEDFSLRVSIINDAFKKAAEQLGVKVQNVTVSEVKTDPKTCKLMAKQPASVTMDFGKWGTEYQYECTFSAKLSSGIMINNETAYVSFWSPEEE